jgi:hypothetical protein
MEDGTLRGSVLTNEVPLCLNSLGSWCEEVIEDIDCPAELSTLRRVSDFGLLGCSGFVGQIVDAYDERPLVAEV